MTSTPTNCPADGSVLSAFEIDGLCLDTCSKCGGLWFDRDELRRAEHLADPGVEWMDFEIWRSLDRFRIEPRAHACPKCKKPMTRLRYGNTRVEVDNCSSCGGVWIEAGGFERIIRALEDEAARRPASEYMRQTLREALTMLEHPSRIASEWSSFKQVYGLLKLRVMVEHPALIKAILASNGANPL